MLHTRQSELKKCSLRTRRKSNKLIRTLSICEKISYDFILHLAPVLKKPWQMFLSLMRFWMANPLTTDELRKAAYKVREFTTVEAMSMFGIPIKKDAAIEPEDTYQSSIDELGKAYRQIVEEQNQKRANLLNDKSRRKLFRRIADSSK